MAGQSVQEAVNKRPLLVLRSMIGKNIFLRLKNDHSIYKGKLLNVDVQMNLIMGGTMEYEGGKETVNFDLVLVRGSNILFVGKADDL
ncbi:MAG: LSM domain-containing protein [Thermoproteota archaeon]